MPTYTLASLQENIWDGLDNNQGLYAAANLTMVINEILRRVNLLTAFQMDTVALSGFSVANQLIYQCPASVVVPMRVYYEERELEKTSLLKLSQRFRDWTDDYSVTLGPPARWAPIDTQSFVIHPIDSYGGSLIEVEGITAITPLVNPDDVAPIEDEYADLVVDYGKSRTRLKLAGKPFADAAMAYQDMIRKLKGMVAWEGMKWPRFFLDLEKELEKADGKGTGAQ